MHARHYKGVLRHHEGAGPTTPVSAWAHDRADAYRAAIPVLTGPDTDWTSAATGEFYWLPKSKTRGTLRVNKLTKTRISWPLARFSVRGLTSLAAALAGRKRLALRAEWRAHLAGESGHDPVTWQKFKEALGFVISAIQCRCSDAAEAAWTPVDATLKSRKLSNLFVLVPAWAAAYLVLRHEGTLGVVKAAESISAIGGLLYGLVRVGRWWRNVKPPEPKARAR